MADDHDHSHHHPVERSVLGWSLIYFAAAVVTVAGVRAASAVIVPLLLSAFLAVVLLPLLRLLQTRMPFPVAFVIVVTLLAGLLLAPTLVIGSSAQQLIGALPQLRDQVVALEGEIVEQLAKWDVEVGPDDVGAVLDPSAITGLLSTFLNSTLRLLSDSVVVLIATAFILSEAAWFSEKIAVIDNVKGDSTRRVAQIVEGVRQYLRNKTVVSLATGLSVWLGLMLLGVKYANVWGFVAFLLNYVPTIGSIIAGVPPIFLALLQQQWGTAAAIFVLYLVVNQLFGSVLEPRLQGRGLGLSPLVVFVSFVFWGWALGPVGMFLSTPITMTLKIACDEFPDTKWIAALLGSRPVVTPPEATR